MRTKADVRPRLWILSVALVSPTRWVGQSRRLWYLARWIISKLWFFSRDHPARLAPAL